MNNNEPKRISRLTAIITQLQTKRLVTATELAAKFAVSVRTIYRDIRALEEAGVPLYVEEGRGYSIMEHYRLPPVMFTESEASALILAEQLVLSNRDASLVKEYWFCLKSSMPFHWGGKTSNHKIWHRSLLSVRRCVCLSLR